MHDPNDPDQCMSRLLEMKYPSEIQARLDATEPYLREDRGTYWILWKVLEFDKPRFPKKIVYVQKLEKPKGVP